MRCVIVAMASASFLQVGEGVVNQVSRVAQEIVLYLEIPSGTDVWNAGSETWKESCEAVRSISHFILLVGRPFFLAACWILLHLGRFLWEYVVVEGLYNHGLSQSKEIILAFWRFQTSLSQKEFIFEACLGSTLVALYFLRRWLQRNRYIQRARRSLNLQLQKVGRVSAVAVIFAGLSSILALPECIWCLSVWGRQLVHIYFSNSAFVYVCLNSCCFLSRPIRKNTKTQSTDDTLLSSLAFLSLTIAFIHT